MGKFEVWYEVTFWLFRDGLGCPLVAIVSRKTTFLGIVHLSEYEASSSVEPDYEIQESNFWLHYPDITRIEKYGLVCRESLLLSLVDTVFP